MAAARLILTVSDPDGLPSVEVCDSMDECVNSIRFQMSDPTPEKIKEMRDVLVSKLEWTDKSGIKFSIRKRGGK